MCEPANPGRSSLPDGLAPEFAAYASWDGLRARMSESVRSDEGRAAGVWAIDVLRDQLGSQWMERVALAEGRAPNDLLLSVMHAVAFGELLGLALRLHLLRDVEGMGVVRRDLKRDLREQRRLHTRVILDIAALALQNGHGVAMEKRLAVDLAPTDVVITTPSGDVISEAFAVLTDDVMRQGMDYTEALAREVRRICWGNAVELDGQLQAVLTDEATSDWLARVEEVALLVKSDGKARVVDHPIGPVTVLSLAEAAQCATSFTGPLMTGKGNDRLGVILRKKAEQAAMAGATWIRADVLDGLWQFTQWAGWTLSTKSEALAAEVRQALDGIEGVRGAVLSCGPAMAQGDFVGESTRVADGGFALRRVFPPFRVRETVVIPLGPEHASEAMTWVELYDGEPGWLDWALGAVGLPSASDVLSVPRQT